MKPFLLVFLLLMMTQSSLFGQFLRLDLSTDDPGNDGYSLDVPCSLLVSNSLALNILNLTSQEYMITGINANGNTGNTLQSTSPQTPLSIQANQQHPLFLNFMYDWENMTLTDGMVIHISFAYLLPKNPKTYIRNITLTIRGCKNTDDGDGPIAHTPTPSDGKKRIGQKHQGFIQISPNPVQDDFLVKYQLEVDDFVKIDLYNGLGQKIKSICENKFQKEGTYTINSDFPEENPKGIYYLVFQIGDSVHTEKVIKL